MYCAHCQAPLADGAAFCSSCGRPTNVPPSSIPDLTAMPDNASQPYAQPYQQPYPQPVYYPQQNVTQSVVVQPTIVTSGHPSPDAYMQHQQQMALRQHELKVLGDVTRHFSSHQSDYDAYEQNCKKVLEYARGTSSALLVWGIIATVLGLLFTTFAPGFATVLWGPGVLMVIGGIAMLVAGNSKRNSLRQKHQKLTQQLYDHYQQYTNCPVGPEYTNPKVLQVLTNILQSGRCDTIKEAINCMLAGTNQTAVNRYYQQLGAQISAANAAIGISIIFAPSHLYK